MDHWFLFELEQQRRRDEVERAAAHHYAKDILRHAWGDQRSQRRYETVLAALGDFLIALGCRLRTRYRRLAATTNHMSTETRLAQQQADSAGCARFPL